MKVALVYDRINKWGGAERILLALNELYPDADLYTSVYDNTKAPWAKVFNIKTSFVNNFKLTRNRHELLPYLMPIAFEQFNFDKYDLVISVTSEAAKGVLTKPGTTHICYILTPTRYLWSGYDEYFSNKIFRFIAMPIVNYLRRWDLIASMRPDHYVSISNEVRLRTKKYYKKDSNVIYPPININLIDSTQKESVGGKYFLVVSRLVPYKRVDLAVKACTRLGLSLKVIGTGSELSNLKNIAGDSVEFLGSLTDEELVQYYKGCQALIFPGHEDFGLTVIEAQMFGRPVIAYKKGGALETIKNRKTGLFFENQTITSLENALVKFGKIKFKKKDCVDNAEQFGKNIFKLRFEEEINRLINK